ncbi:hypothetical protein [Noviherbaspirillum autotrophicum]|uniref:hypothetical protein n=1 Tax=Noviherbaspirillum autotrophicum TaxID=709839 RepID=UPI0012FE4D77|nr:hypothetical protein [Noviherbaspirillum autotrophicum]
MKEAKDVARSGAVVKNKFGFEVEHNHRVNSRGMKYLLQSSSCRWNWESSRTIVEPRRIALQCFYVPPGIKSSRAKICL